MEASMWKPSPGKRNAAMVVQEFQNFPSYLPVYGFSIPLRQSSTEGAPGAGHSQSHLGDTSSTPGVAEGWWSIRLGRGRTDTITPQRTLRRVHTRN